MKLIGLFSIFLFIPVIQCICQQGYVPQTGDLLFQDLDCGPFCDAIEKVTTGVDGKSFSHVGVVYVDQGKPYVLEAGSRGVVKTSLDSFLNRSFDANHYPKVVAGRLKPSLHYTIPKAIDKCNSLLGKKYDDAFDISNDRYYCSELVYYAFNDSTSKPLFNLAPMTFIDPETHKTFPAWVTYFNDLGIPIPEGKPGLNPGGISRSDKIEIVHSFY